MVPHDGIFSKLKPFNTYDQISIWLSIFLKTQEKYIMVSKKALLMRFFESLYKSFSCVSLQITTCVSCSMRIDALTLVTLCCSAASSYQPGHHEVSVISSNLHDPDCY